MKDKIVDPLVTQIKLALLKVSLDLPWSGVGFATPTAGIYTGLANAGLAIENSKIITSVVPK